MPFPLKPLIESTYNNQLQNPEIFELILSFCRHIWNMSWDAVTVEVPLCVIKSNEFEQF